MKLVGPPTKIAKLCGVRKWSARRDLATTMANKGILGPIGLNRALARHIEYKICYKFLVLCTKRKISS